MIKTIYGIALGVLLTLIVFAFPAKIFAACQGHGCSWKWPEQQGCAADAWTPRRVCAGICDIGFEVEIRRSQHCNANWARATNRTGFQFWVNVTNWWGNGMQHTRVGEYAWYQQRWTQMLGPSHNTKACGAYGVSPPPNPVPNNHSWCTSWFGHPR
jgi:hypothetical protein